MFLQCEKIVWVFVKIHLYSLVSFLSEIEVVMNKLIKLLFTISMLTMLGCSQSNPCEPQLCTTNCINGYSRCDVSDSAMDACIAACDDLAISSIECLKRAVSEGIEPYFVYEYCNLPPLLLPADPTEEDYISVGCSAVASKVLKMNCDKFKDAFETEPRSPWD
jgi:hypothetical protein